MVHRALRCPNCGGPLPSQARWRTSECGYCHQTVTVAPDRVLREDFQSVQRSSADTGASVATGPVLRVGALPLELLDRLGTGASTDVLRARRADGIPEKLVVHRLAVPGDRDLLGHAHAALDRLARSEVKGAAHFGNLLPQPVAFGESLAADGTRGLALVVRTQPPFRTTLADLVRTRAGRPVDPRHGVWLWRRLLEVLDFVHRSALLHGAVVPEHVLVDTQGHGATLVGWSAASDGTGPLRAWVAGREAFYPKAARGGRAYDTLSELSMAARCVAWFLGAHDDPTHVPASVPEPVADLLRGWLVPRIAPTDAWALREAVGAAAERAFGPPEFVPWDIPPAAS